MIFNQVGKAEIVLSSYAVHTGGVTISYAQLGAHLQISFGVWLFAYFIIPSDKDIFVDLFS